MATPEDNETIVDRELTKARAHDPEPPAWFFYDPHTRWAPKPADIYGASSTE